MNGGAQAVDSGILAIAQPIPNATTKLDVNGTVELNLATGVGTSVCQNPIGILTNCSASSIRFKDAVASFGGGADVIRRLRPVMFRWKENGESDFGLIAEEVHKVEPCLSTYAADGQVEGVRYDRLAVLLINGMKEHQTRADELQRGTRCSAHGSRKLEAAMERFDAQR
jgi:hypothetical protein